MIVHGCGQNGKERPPLEKPIRNSHQTSHQILRWPSAHRNSFQKQKQLQVRRLRRSEETHELRLCNLNLTQYLKIGVPMSALVAGGTAILLIGSVTARKRQIYNEIGVKSAVDCCFVIWYRCFMSRPLRIQYPDAWYHVMNRGRRGESVFLDKNDYAMFVDLLKEEN